MLNKPPVLFPDTAAWAVDYLGDAIDARGESYCTGVTVATKVPAQMPARLVTVRDDGGPDGSTVTKTCSLGLNVYAATDADCSDLARMVAALMRAAPDDGPITAHLNASGPYPVPEQSGKPHLYLSADLLVSGSAL